MKKTLVITGAGASYSIKPPINWREKNEKDLDQSISHFSYGKLDPLPLGDELVAKISDYKTKSICWLISLLIHEKIFDFEGESWNQFFYDLGNNLEKNFSYFLEYFCLRNHDSNKIRSKFKEFVEQKSNQKIYQLFKISKINFDEKILDKDLIENFILFEILKYFETQLSVLLSVPKILDLVIEEFRKIINDILNKVNKLLRIHQPGIVTPNGSINEKECSSIFQVKSELWDQLINQIKEDKSVVKSETTDCKIKSGIEKILMHIEKILELKGGAQAHFNINNFFGIDKCFSKKSWEEIKTPEVLSRINNFKDDLTKNIENNYNEIKNLHSIADIFNEYLPRNPGPTFFTCFDGILKEVNKIKHQIFKISIKLESLLTTQNHKNLDKSLDHLKGCFIVANIIEYYKPYSIDYFMMNIEQVAHYEFYSTKNENNNLEKLNPSEASKRKKYLHIYAKLIIANILFPSSLYHSFVARYHDNYFKKLWWKFLQDALFHYKQKWNNECFEEYLHENVKIITFNYDNSFENIFWENSEITDNSKKFIKNNLKHVYGQIFLKLGKNDQINLTENCLWKGLFSFINEGVMRLYLPKKDSPKEICEVDNIFEELDENIKWIGQEESPEITKDRESYYRWLIEANEIYILGFGFDENNLYRIGLINEFGNLEKDIFLDKEKKIFISGVNAKIINQIRNLLISSGFKFNFSNICKNVFEITFDKNVITLSENYLPEVLNKDF